jgi:hypothetical protein
MSELVADCPRCGANNMTHELLASIRVGERFDWQGVHEAFCKCRHCGRSTIYVLSELEVSAKAILRKTDLRSLPISVNNMMEVEGHISLKDAAARSAPDYVPLPIRAAFEEGAACLAIRRPNAAASMFRLCLDLATTPLLPAEPDTPPATVRRSLGRRLNWLFDQDRLPHTLKDLSTCIREDGNDAAHGGTLTVEDAEDIADFLSALLQRLYTEPERIRLATERRSTRRGPQAG